MKNVWDKVRPKSNEFPKRADESHFDENLPNLTPGEKAAISPIHPIVTVKKNSYACLKLHQENITLMQDPDPTWASILPRTHLKDRFMIIERTAKDGIAKYIGVIANHVRQWLCRLFETHPGFLQMQADGKLEKSEECIKKLEQGEELAEADNEYEETELKSRHEKRSLDANESGVAQSSQQLALSETHMFAFKKLHNFYLNKKDALKLHKDGKIEIVKDKSVCKQVYNVSATMVFPYLYPYGEMSPTNFKYNIA